jgi:hypothetical protein
LKLEIHQIFYKEEQRSLLSPAFLPYDNSQARPPNNFEFDVFMSNYNGGKIQADLTGFVSWKFEQKTGISGLDFKNFILNNPGYDIYFINPFPHLARFRNVWTQGDHFHPELTALTQSLLKKSGYQINLGSIVNRMDTLCYCNYWVGSQRFWRRYIEFIQPLYHYLNHQLSSAEQARLYQQADAKIRAPYPPFIFERLFSTFLALNLDLKSAPYAYTDEQLRQKGPRHFKLLKAMHDSIQQNQKMTYDFYQVALNLSTFGAEILMNWAA